MQSVIQIQVSEGPAYAIKDGASQQYYQTCYQFRTMADYQNIRVKPDDGSQWFTDTDPLTYSTETPPQ